MKERTKLPAFTLIETIIVIGIITVLAGTTGFSAITLIEHSKKAASQTQIATFTAALQMYYLDCELYPTTEQGLSALYSKPTLHPVPIYWDGPYIDQEIPNDPWGEPYLYQNLTNNGEQYEITDSKNCSNSVENKAYIPSNRSRTKW